MSSKTDLPSYEQIRRNARGCLSDARDWLIYDWSDTEITDEQGNARHEALKLIGKAKAALDRAG